MRDAVQVRLYRPKPSGSRVAVGPYTTPYTPLIGYGRKLMNKHSRSNGK